MPASTRSSNKKSDFKAYYSKIIPKQSHFPHRRKLVRRPNDDDAPETRQMTFVPEKMTRRETVDESGNDNSEDLEAEDEDLEEGGVATVKEPVQPKNVKGKPKAAAKKGKKRTSNIMEDQTDEHELPVQPTPKRMRKAAVPKQRQSGPRAESESEDEHFSEPAESEFEEDQKRRRRRQSTMTQMVDNRRPLPGAIEPKFKPLKKVARMSWTGKGNKNQEMDKKQRTLTQMVPGINKSFGILSDSEVEEVVDREAERRESQAYNDALTQRLIAQGLLHPADDNDEAVAIGDSGVGDPAESVTGDDAQLQIAVDGPGTEDSLPTVEAHDEDTEDEYQPTQFVDAPVTKTTRATRRSYSRQQPSLEIAAQTSAQKAPKSRFGLLSTPERRRVREIASSQSPAGSMISTQNTPHRSGRTPLTSRSANAAIAAAQTPSKRKQVAFHEPMKEQRPPRRSLRRFASTILDSEDDDEPLEDDDDDDAGNMGAGSQAMFDGITSRAEGVSIGADTQAVLDLIDQACENDETKDVTSLDETDAAPGASATLFTNSNFAADQLVYAPPSEEHEASGEPSGTSHVHEAVALPQRSPSRLYSTARPGIKCELSNDENNMATLPLPVAFPSHQTPNAEHPGVVEAAPTKVQQRSPLVGFLPSTPPLRRTQLQDTYPSSPMFIDDSSSEEGEDEPAPTPPSGSRQTPLCTPQPEEPPVQALDDPRIQVSRSPSPAAEDENHEESQLSHLHSAAAEQQLHSEYASYSQYRPVGPLPSSMQVGHETGFSYQATPFPPRPQLPPPNHLVHSGGISQATTVDLTQTQNQRQNSHQDLPLVSMKPQKPNSKSQPTRSAPTTPHKIPSSQPNFSSPNRPPSLFIPSSFPSPSRVFNVGEMDEDYSTPMLMRGDGVGASGAGKGYSQWFGEGQEGMELGGSYENFSIPAPPPMAINDGDDQT